MSNRFQPENNEDGINNMYLSWL